MKIYLVKIRFGDDRDIYNDSTLSSELLATKRVIELEHVDPNDEEACEIFAWFDVFELDEKGPF